MWWRRYIFPECRFSNSDSAWSVGANASLLDAVKYPHRYTDQHADRYPYGDTHQYAARYANQHAFTDSYGYAD